jgi:hypothetical protein
MCEFNVADLTTQQLTDPNTIIRVKVPAIRNSIAPIPSLTAKVLSTSNLN